MDEVGDGLNLVGGSIDEAEGVGGLVADGGHADGAHVEEVVEEAGLGVGNIFDAGELDDIRGFVEEGVGGDLDGAFVGDVHFVIEIDLGADDAGQDEDAVEAEDDEANETGRGGEGRVGGGAKAEQNQGQDEKADDFREPDEDESEAGTGDGENDVFAVLEREEGEILRGTGVAKISESG